MVEDLAPDGSRAPGGPSLYAARTAAALGARVTLVTRLTPGYDRRVLAGVEVHALPATAVPCYANSYDAAGDRTQLLLDPGEPLDATLALDPPADALIVAPAYHEFAALPVIPARLLALSLQGILRRVDGARRVLQEPEPATATLPFTAPGSFAFDPAPPA